MATRRACITICAHRGPQVAVPPSPISAPASSPFNARSKNIPAPIVSRDYVMESMPTTTTDVVQLVTRIPYQLSHRAKIHCVAHDMTLGQFVIDAIRERLGTAQYAKESGRRAAAR